MLLVCPSFNYGWRPEDAVRVLRILARPILIGLIVVAIGAALLYGAQGLAPFLNGGGVTSPQFQIQTQERARDEQQLRAEVNTFLDSVTTPEAATMPNHVGEQP